MVNHGWVEGGIPSQIRIRFSYAELLVISKCDPRDGLMVVLIPRIHGDACIARLVDATGLLHLPKCVITKHPGNFHVKCRRRVIILVFDPDVFE